MVESPLGSAAPSPVSRGSRDSDYTVKKVPDREGVRIQEEV